MDWKYIIKRVLVGVLIFIAIYFLRNYIFLEVHASTINASTSCVFSETTGPSSEVCKTPPNLVPGGNEINIWYTNQALIEPGVTYAITFRVEIIGLDSNVELYNSQGVRHLSFFTGNDGSAGYTALPDRNESYNYYHTDRNTAYLVWSFELDSSHSYNTFRISFFTNAKTGTVGGISYINGGVNSATLSITPLSSGGGSSSGNDDIIVNNNQNTQNIINNDNTNTQNIINSNNSNTEDIINNNNTNTQDIINSSRVCKTIDSSNIKDMGSYLNSSGGLTDASTFGITDYINIKNATIKLYKEYPASTGAHLCFYNDKRNLISCSSVTSFTIDTPIPLPEGAHFVRFSIRKSSSTPSLVNVPQFQVCTDGNQALNDSLNDDNTSKEESDFQDFFDDFNYGDDTLTSVVTAPLRFINSLTDTCSPVTLNVLGQDVVLPCGDTIFWSRNDVSTFRTFWNLLFGGAIIYALALKLYKVIHSAFDPDKDNIETVGV